jgi:hypothetical protein
VLFQKLHRKNRVTLLLPVLPEFDRRQEKSIIPGQSGQLENLSILLCVSGATAMFFSAPYRIVISPDEGEVNSLFPPAYPPLEDAVLPSSPVASQSRQVGETAAPPPVRHCFQVLTADGFTVDLFPGDGKATCSPDVIFSGTACPDSCRQRCRRAAGGTEVFSLGRDAG